MFLISFSFSRFSFDEINLYDAVFKLLQGGFHAGGDKILNLVGQCGGGQRNVDISCPR